MNFIKLKDFMENYQIAIYFIIIAIAILITFIVPNTSNFESMINPALALMLFVTFLQVPISELSQAFRKTKFIFALLFSNFIIIPILVFILIQFLPDNPLLRLGVLFVLLTPCVDYVVTFSHLGKADSKLILASTPILLIIQMLLLPVYLSMFLGKEASNLVEITPFIEAFIFLILIPFVLATFFQIFSKKSIFIEKLVDIFNLLPVPSTAFVLFVVILTVIPQLSQAINDILFIIPIYIAFAIIAPIIGFNIGRLFIFEVKEKSAIAFSSATRNSLIILPLALAIPNALPLLPAVIVTQTFIELISSIIYIFIFKRLNKKGF
ncbi:arsenic resistance protein [Aliarcobacter lanthieri]|uniref:arsenic resistance protein n=1 Tax=Aliarcobacter lanthieri TaxID=1355374 RepID=UPI00047D57A5|nr:arsenic resistance protein [Aliarcobacter lanthieri]QKF60230.1 putative arsenite efflux pump, ArsB/Acr3 family [Aliarcobacter lanthieri]